MFRIPGRTPTPPHQPTASRPTPELGGRCAKVRSFASFRYLDVLQRRRTNLRQVGKLPNLASAVYHLKPQSTFCGQTAGRHTNAIEANWSRLKRLHEASPVPDRADWTLPAPAPSGPLTAPPDEGICFTHFKNPTVSKFVCVTIVTLCANCNRCFGITAAPLKLSRLRVRTSMNRLLRHSQKLAALGFATSAALSWTLQPYAEAFTRWSQMRINKDRELPPTEKICRLCDQVCTRLGLPPHLRRQLDLFFTDSAESVALGDLNGDPKGYAFVGLPYFSRYATEAEIPLQNLEFAT
ncbi:hypothetical protein SprV_0902697000 [Sparganum proliferum]